MDYLKEIIYDLEDRMRNIGDFYAIYKIINSSGKFNSNITTEDIMNFIEKYIKEGLKEDIDEMELVELTYIAISKLNNKGLPLRN